MGSLRLIGVTFRGIDFHLEFCWGFLVWGSLGGQFGSLWGHRRIFLGHCVFMLESFWDHSGFTLGSYCDFLRHCWIVVEYF